MTKYCAACGHAKHLHAERYEGDAGGACYARPSGLVGSYGCDCEEYVADDRFCAECDRPHVCAIIQAGTAPCGRNKPGVPLWSVADV